MRVIGRNRIGKTIIAAVLAVAMVIMYMPSAVFADSTDQSAASAASTKQTTAEASSTKTVSSLSAADLGTFTNPTASSLGSAASFGVFANTYKQNNDMEGTIAAKDYYGTDQTCGVSGAVADKTGSTNIMYFENIYNSLKTRTENASDIVLGDSITVSDVSQNQDLSLIKLAETSTGFSQQYNGLKEIGKSLTNVKDSTYKIDFASAFSGLKTYSAAQYSKANTGVTVTKNTSGDKNDWSIDIKCAAGADVVNLTEEEIENCTLNITGTGSASLIINVTGTSNSGSYTFNKKVTVDGTTGGYGSSAGKVMFNFGSEFAGTASFQESSTGAILAPNATVKIIATHNGSVYANSVENVNGEIHENPFTPEEDTATGSITVNKTVTGAGSITKDYYVTLYSDKDCTKKIETKTIAVTAGTTGSATFSGLTPGKTYYAVETDKDGTAISANSDSAVKITGYTFDDESSTLGAQAVTLADTANAAKTVEITNAYTQNKGSLKITKTAAGAGDVTKTFYAGIFSDAECTKLIGSAHAIEVKNGKTGSVTVTDLPAGETYYIAETDKDGNVLSTSSSELSVGSQYELQTINYKNSESEATQKVALADKNGAEASMAITNTYIKKTEEAKITVTKTITGIAAADLAGKDGTIEVDLYQGGSVTGTPYMTATITVKDGVAQNAAVFEKLTPGTYTVAENASTTTLSGDYSWKAVTVDNAGSVTLAGSDEKTVGITNEYTKPETPVTPTPPVVPDDPVPVTPTPPVTPDDPSPSTPKSPTTPSTPASDTSAQTGDTWSGSLWTTLALLAAAAAATALILGKKKEDEEDEDA